MSQHPETAIPTSIAAAMVQLGAAQAEQAMAEGRYFVECRGPDGELKWSDHIDNVVTTEGKTAALHHMLKGSAYTSSTFLGLIESTGYGFAGANGSGVAATNLASSLTAAGGASPANGWNEATTGQCAARLGPTWGTASAGSLATTATAFSILATCTIKGCFLMIKSLAGVASVATTGSTAGAIYSAGLFSGGDKAVGNGDTLSVTYTASL